VRNL